MIFVAGALVRSFLVDAGVALIVLVWVFDCCWDSGVLLLLLGL